MTSGGDTSTSDTPRTLPGWIAALVVACLVATFGVLSYTASLGKSATYDEPLHVVGSLVHRDLHDYRINPEDPALLGRWAALPQGSNALPLHADKVQYDKSAEDVNVQWKYVVDVMYPKNAARGFTALNRARFMFVIAGMMLAGVVALWAYQLGGIWAAIATAVLYCLDPNFLGHAAIVKNDVPLSLLMCAMAYTLWQFGRSGKWWWLLAAAMLCALAINVKYSGILCVPMLAIVLLARAFFGGDWRVCGIELDSMVLRMLVVPAGVLLALVLTWAVTWLDYGCRYPATADATPVNAQAWFDMSVITQIRAEAEEDGQPSPPRDQLEMTAVQRIQNGEVALPVQLDRWLMDSHLLPQAWCYGFIYTYTTTLLRNAYLLGDTRLTGWWYYFPLTMLFKTPTTTLLFAVLVIVGQWIGARSSKIGLWPMLALAIIPCIYFLMAIKAHLNLGLRHILPVYPFIFVALGLGFANLVRRWHKRVLIVGALLALCLLTETALAYPNYIAYFNLPSGGTRGGLRLLSGSNLDWGQDLPALAEWRKKHPEGPLYLAYSATASPVAYGIDCINLKGGWTFKGAGTIDQPGTLAISASNLQRNFWSPDLVQWYLGILNPEKLESIRNDANLTPTAQTDAIARALREAPPDEVLNGTIYLYHVSHSGS